MATSPSRPDPRLSTPLALPGQTIGLLGGSFNPPHEGHALISRIAFKRLGLDRVWWLVTPGNPLKDKSDLASLEARLNAAEALAPPRVVTVTGLEAGLPTTFTAATLTHLLARNPGVNFVWLMGADNLAGFHRWQNWRRIAAMVPVAVIDRPGATHRALRSPAGVALARWRLPEAQARALAAARPPAWVFLHGRRSDLSSTALRALRRRPPR